jgi:hypothetical protein
MAQTEAVTVRKQIVVGTPIERAVTVFTDRFGAFQARSTTCSGHRSPRRCSSPVGGNIMNRAAAASECRWARILAFEPPDRLAFSWDISSRWTIETDRAQASEVEVRFYAESPARTPVELEHHHLERHGPGSEQVQDGVDGPAGRPLYLDRYATLVKGAS